MTNHKELITEVGRIVKYKNGSRILTIPVLHKLSKVLHTPNVTLANCVVKDINHLCLFDSENSGQDFIYTVNATSSSRLHGLSCIPCDYVNHSLTYDEEPIVETCRAPGYYAYSYVNNKLLNSNYFEGKVSIKLAAGLTHTNEQSKVFNTVLNTYRFKYMTEMVNRKSTGILLTDVKGRSSTSYLLKNNALIEFMRYDDKNNILLDIARVDIDDNFRIGLDHINNDFGVDTLTNLYVYGNEGLDYLDIITT
jgi:hypothetical protein